MKSFLGFKHERVIGLINSLPSNDLEFHNLMLFYANICGYLRTDIANYYLSGVDYDSEIPQFKEQVKTETKNILR